MPFLKSRFAIFSLIVSLLSMLPLAPLAGAQTKERLSVCTDVIPPFISYSQGKWSGLDIRVWEEIASEHGFHFDYQKSGLQHLIPSLTEGDCDVFIGALTMTPEREKMIDFSHSYFESGLGIAVKEEGNVIWAALSKVFSWKLFAAVMSLVFLLLGVGACVWFFERKKNSEEFGGGILQGLGSAFWWSAVTMTTVGYGDKSPRTLGGRFVALIWMFTSIVVISGFTASIASVLTLSSFEGRVRSVADLRNVKTGTVRNSSSAEELQRRDISFSNVASLQEGFEKLRAGEIEALVYDKPLLVHRNQSFPPNQQVIILPLEFAKQNYSIALRPGSELREEVNLTILRLLTSGEIQALEEAKD